MSASKARESPTQLPAAVEPLMTVADLAAALKVSTRMVHLMISTGQYPEYDLRIGRMARWTVSGHNAWLARQCGAKE